MLYRKTLTYRNAFQYRVKGIAPVAWDSSVFGAPTVSQQIFVAGFASDAYGTATVQNFVQYVTPSGFDSPAFGTAALVNIDQFIRPTGWDSSAFSNATWVSNWIRYLQPSGFQTDALGAPLVSAGIRYIDLVSQGPRTDVYGTAFFDLGIRYVYPQWFVTMVFGTPMMGYTLVVAPTGWQQDEWGTGFIHDNKQYIDQAGNMAGAVGQPTIYQLNRQVWPVTVWEADEFRFGITTSVRNTRQYIAATYIETQWNDPNGVVNSDAHIYNVNRELDLIHNGIAPLFQQVPITHEVRNGAQGCPVEGFDASAFGQQLIAYRIRNVAPVAWESFIDGEYRVVYNAAFAVNPRGWDSAVLGVPENVVNTRRYFGYWGIGETLDVGTPFIAPAIRTLLPLAIEPGRFGTDGLNVWFRVRTLAPAGWQYTPFGNVALDIHFNVVRPNQIPPIDAYGLPRVANVTPNVYPYWDEALFTFFGQTAIFNQNNYYQLQGFATQAFGMVYVADRTQHIIAPPMNTLIFQNLTQVRNEIPDPPATQKVFPPPVQPSIDSEPAKFGALTMTANSLYPLGWVNDVYGSALVYVNGIFPTGITPPWSGDDHSEMGHPSVNPTQYVTFAGSNQPPTDDPNAPTQQDLFMFAAGKPRFTPYTIYAPQGGTQQYKDNNPPGFDQPMDAVNMTAGYSSMPAWGRPTVSNWIRTVFVSDTAGADGYLRWGDARASTNPQYVNVDGIRSFKYGVPRVNNGQELQVVGFDALTFDGMPVVSLVPEQDRVLPVQGADMAAFGLTWVANWIRELPIVGIAPGPFGTAHPQFPPPPALPNGLDTAVFGKALVAYRIRHLLPEGWDSFTCDYTLGQFADRMRVIGMGGLRPQGISVSIFGLAQVGPRLRGVQAQGIPVGPIAVSIPTVRRFNNVALGGFGWDSALFGDVQRWEPGTIKPQGDDFLGVGVAALSRTIPATTLDETLLFGHLRATASIGVAGLDAAEYGDAVVMGFGCGRQARAINGWESLLMGNAGIVFAPPAGSMGAIGFSSQDMGRYNVHGANTVRPNGIGWPGGSDAKFSQFGGANVDRTFSIDPNPGGGSKES